MLPKSTLKSLDFVNYCGINTPTWLSHVANMKTLSTELGRDVHTLST